MSVTLSGTAKNAGPDGIIGNADDTTLSSDRQLSNTLTLTYKITAGSTPDASCTPANNAPTVSTDAQNVSGNEGSALANSGAFSDVDTTDTLTITKLSGAGTVTPSTTTRGAWSWSHTPNDNGSGTVEVQVSDGKGGTAVDSFDWTANNVAPTATFNKPASVNEGSNINLSLTSPFDPSSADTTAGFTYAFDCGDGNGYSTFSSTSTASCPTTDNGTRSVGAKIKDKDGGVSTYTGSVTVDNVAPVLSALSLSGNTGTACLSGNTVNLSFSFSDVGSGDSHNGTISWGDGSSDTFTSSPQNNVQHTYGAGTYTITVTVNDDDSGSDSDTAQVTRLYNVSKLLEPVNLDGTSVFKSGSVVPLKVKITDCNGQFVSGLSPKVGSSLASAADPLVGINETLSSVSAADSGNIMRPADGFYIYNLSTKSLGTDQNATYKIIIQDSKATTTVPAAFGPAVSQVLGVRAK